MFADVYKDRKDFFADLLKKHSDDEGQPVAPAQKTPTADSSQSDLFMTTISEMAEKDVPETSAENYTGHSATIPSSTTGKTASEDKAPQQATTASTHPTSSEFDSYELSKTQVPEAPSDRVSKEIPQDKAESPGGKLVEYKSFDSQPKEAETAPEAPERNQAGVEKVKGESVDLLTTETKSDEKKGQLGELLPSEQFQSAKAMQVSSVGSLEAASTRTEVPTEVSGHGYVPALTESTFEGPGATSEEHQLGPTSLEGSGTASDATIAEKNKNLPFSSHTEEPTNEEYSAKEGQDKETSNILAGHPEQDSELISSEQAPLSDTSMTQRTDDMLTSTQIVEAKPTEKHDGIPFTEPAMEPMKEHYAPKQEHDKQTSSIFAGDTEKDRQTISSKQAPLADVNMTQHTDDVLTSAQIGASGVDENVSVRETAKASESTDIVAKTGT
ncbi:hypothetical protein MTO96_000337 [Rhipicephalus appendiculatus]